MVATAKVHHQEVTGKIKCFSSNSVASEFVILNRCYFCLELVIRMGRRHPQVVAHLAHRIQAMRRIKANSRRMKAYRIR